MTLPVLHPGGASQRGSHRLSSVLSCPRRWYLHNVLRVVTPAVPHFAIGSAVHLVLAYRIAERDLGANRPGWMQVPLDVALAKECLGFPSYPAQARQVGEAYLRWEQPGLSTVSIETEYGATIGELRAVLGRTDASPFDAQVVTARIDRLTRDRAGGLWAIDYKTTGRGDHGRLPAEPPRAQWSLPWQFMVQTLILRATFPRDFRGTVLDRILLADPPDFRRDPVGIPKYALHTAFDLLVKAVKEEDRLVLEARQHAGEPWLPEGHFWSCNSYGTLCEMAAVCMQGDMQAAYDTARSMQRA